jgi:LmbE family N-acetylglucosaminyl deacetylase
MVRRGEFGRILAVSPHLDDAVLSAGGLLGEHPGSVVATVFAGFPSAYEGVTEWDAACGFGADDDVVALRRAEDHRAARDLGVTCSWLDFVDDQYADARPPIDEIAAALRDELAAKAFDTVAIPLGIEHRDHQRTHDACMKVLESGSDLRWLAWVDVPYRAHYPEQVEQKLTALRDKGFDLAELTLRPGDRKRAAVGEYATQLRALGAEAVDDAERPEQFVVLKRSRVSQG